MMLLIYAIIGIGLPQFIASKKVPLNVRMLSLENSVEYATNQRPGFFSPDLQIYCYAGKPKHPLYTFQTINLDLDIVNDDFVQYDGNNPEEVNEHYESQRSIFSWTHLLSTNKKKQVRMNPFNQTCIGVETAHPYKIHLRLIRIDFWKVLLMLAGIFFFLKAYRLSEAPVFYYTGGVVFGIVCSLFLVVYFLGKLLPGKTVMYGSIVGGWAVGMYFLQMLWENARVIMFAHQIYVFWYVCITGLISFLICYRVGPPTNRRSIDIIKWALQATATIMIYVSSEFQEIAVAVVIVIFVYYYCPKSVILTAKSYWIRRFPPKRKLLSLDEYDEQGVIETRKALEELKVFCSSPESKPWKTVSRLKNPKRFASFVEGEPHVLDDELLLHESTDDLNSFNHEPVIEPNESDSDISDDEDDLVPTPILMPNRSVRSTLPRERLAVVNNSREANGGRQIRYTDVEISDDD